MEGIEVIFQPTHEHLSEIKQWLLVEDQKKRFAGFYCNWNSIEYSFDRNEMSVILQGKSAIGFLTWFNYTKVTKIQIAEIKPGFRKKGYGRILTQTVLDHLIRQGFVVAYLHCQPATSETAWKKIGFMRYPQVPDFADYNNKEEGRHLYKILVPCADQSKSPTEKQIELWSVESYLSSRHMPKWRWELKFNANGQELEKPIIAPAKRKWDIRWQENGQIIKDGQIKYFDKTDIDYCDFIIIESMPAR